MSHKPCQICSKHLAHRGLKTCALTPLFFLRNFAHGNICSHIFGCKVTIVISFHCSVHNSRSYFSCKSTNKYCILQINSQENYNPISDIIFNKLSKSTFLVSLKVCITFFVLYNHKCNLCREGGNFLFFLT